MLKLGCLSNLFVEIFDLWLDTLRFIRLSLRSHFALAAENLFLRKQLALYLERQVKPRRAEVSTKLTMVLLIKGCWPSSSPTSKSTASTRRTVGPPAAVILTALLFAFFHQPPTILHSACFTVSGIVYGWNDFLDLLFAQPVSQQSGYRPLLSPKPFSFRIRLVGLKLQAPLLAGWKIAALAATVGPVLEESFFRGCLLLRQEPGHCVLHKWRLSLHTFVLLHFTGKETTVPLWRLNHAPKPIFQNTA